MAKLRIPAMLLLFVSAALIEAFRLSSLSTLTNADIWWHLSSGLWMLQHRAFPHSGLFSQSPTLPWIASSWAYDLLLAGGTSWLDCERFRCSSFSLKLDWRW